MKCSEARCDNYAFEPNRTCKAHTSTRLGGDLPAAPTAETKTRAPAPASRTAMVWDGHGSLTSAPAAKTIEALYSPAPAGLPSKEALGAMNVMAHGLPLTDPKSKADGLSVNAVECTVTGKTVTKGGKLVENARYTRKAGGGFCYETEIFKTALNKSYAPGQNLLVHQSVAPCLRCCKAYGAWAAKIAGTLVVAYDAGYDGAPDSSTYIFTARGTHILKDTKKADRKA